jgi:hypothetical protein
MKEKRESRKEKKIIPIYSGKDKELSEEEKDLILKTFDMSIKLLSKIYEELDKISDTLVREQVYKHLVIHFNLILERAKQT